MRPKPSTKQIRHRGDVLVVVLIFVVTVLVRAPGVDRYVMFDEARWLGRSANFYQALSARHWADTYQYVHPGVTVTWLGALAFFVFDHAYANEVDGQLGSTDGEGRSQPFEIRSVLIERGVDPLSMLVKLRLVLIVALAAVTALIFAALWKLVGLAVALVGTGLVMLDPFATGLNRMLHLDALAASLSFLALLQAMRYLTPNGKLSDLIVSGITAGLACLTRVSMLILIPVVGLFVLGSLILHSRQERAGRHIRPTTVFRDLAIWSGVLSLTCLLLWPALWVDPVGVVRDMLSGAEQLASAPHARQAVFDGEVTGADPGGRFYPMVWFWRTTPAVLLGILLAAATFFLPWRRPISQPEKWLVGGSLLWAIAYAAEISIAEKKLEHYLLPTILPLIVVAGWGWVRVSKMVPTATRALANSPWERRTAMSILILPIAMQGILFGHAYPYYLSSYNPIAGGAKAAQSVLSIECGGVDQVAQWLESNGRDGSTVIARDSDYAYLLPGHVLSLFQLPVQKRRDDFFTWVKADYFLLDLPSRNRQLVPPDLVALLDTHEPVKQVTIQGIDCMKLYDLRVVPLATKILVQEPLVTTWNDRFVVFGAEIPGEISGGTPAPVYIYLGRLPGATASDERTEIALSVTDRKGVEVSESRMNIPPPADGESVTRVEGTLVIPDDAKGPLDLDIALVDVGSGKVLSWKSTGQTRPVTVPAVIGRFDPDASATTFVADWKEPTAIEEALPDRAKKVDREQDHKRRGAETPESESN
jgi:hypothetical protein